MVHAEERLPRRVGIGVGIAVEVRERNRGARPPPRGEVVLGLEAGDDGV